MRLEEDGDSRQGQKGVSQIASESATATILIPDSRKISPFAFYSS